MEKSVLGRTGLEVSRLGIGLSEIGSRLSIDQAEEAGRVLEAALDGGTNFLDTAACYGVSEELVGRTVAHRRSEYILATKCGHATGGYVGEPWKAQTIRDSIDRSLDRMRTNYLDLVQLHSCSLDVLKKGEAIQALVGAREAGKVRFIGYSGDNEEARWAVESGVFDTLQTSFSIVDQQARNGLLPEAKARGMGVIIKRPIANVAWGAERSPRPYADEYFRRAQVLASMGPLPGAPNDPIVLAMGFVLAHQEVDTIIVGSRSPDHVKDNIAWMEKGPAIVAEVAAKLHRRFDNAGEQWMQLE